MNKSAVIIGVLILSGCNRSSPPPRDFSNVPASPLILTPAETPEDCHFQWRSPPMEMSATDAAGQANMEVILGFWFGRGNVPIISMKRAISNVLSTPADEFALTMITMEFVTDDSAEGARKALAARMPRATVERRGATLIAAGAGRGATPHCTTSAVERQTQKLESAGKP